MQKTRICKQCGVEHPLTKTNFPISGYCNDKPYHRAICRTCFNEMQKTYEDTCYHSSLENVLRQRYNAARNRSTRKGMDFDITTDYLLELWERQNGTCFYTGVPMTIDRNDNNALSIDRIDSSKGYTRDNVVLVCSSINVMKNSHSIDEFINLCRSVVEHADTTNLY